MYLVKRLTDCHTTLFKFDLHQRQTIDQNRHIVTVGMASRLLKLLNDLHFVTRNGLLVEQVDVFYMAIIKDKIEDIVTVHLASFIKNIVAWCVQVLLAKASPLAISELDLIEGL
ncbi:hypothetical protein VCSRO53_3031 [Vibrio cholerae]|nr:hypothetical protein VCSRO53_3031 [Vibrio cholerae]